MQVDIFFFNIIPRLWNAVPPIDLSLSITTNKKRVYDFLQSRFLSNFRHDNPCTFHFYAHAVDVPTHPIPL